MVTHAEVLRLYKLGMCLIPLQGKKPDPSALDGWHTYQLRRSTREEIDRWFGQSQNRNVGVVAGEVSGVVIVDTDTPEAEAWACNNLPDTPMKTRTAKGFHWYFRLPEAPWRESDIPAILRVDEGVSIEVKRTGQYVVGPGSIHPGDPARGIAPGHVYCAVAPWPESLDFVPPFPMARIAGAMREAAPIRGRQPFVLPATIALGGRNTTLFREGCRLRHLGHSEENIFEALARINSERCQPPLASSEIRSIARSCARYEHGDTVFALSDTGNAKFFAAMCSETVRYDHGRQAWFTFDGQHWRRDRTGEVDRMARNAVRARQEAALGDKEALRWAAGSESRRRREDLVRLARSEEHVAVTGDEWDGDPWLLGVTNGVLDLRTGLLRQGQPEDFVTKVCPVPFEPDAPCPRWTRFVEEIFGDDDEMAAYMQRVIGYSLTVITTEQVFWILCGNGSNGKSTLMETLMRSVLGDAYSWTMPFPAAGWSTAMSEYQKACLAGQRFVQASEVTRQGELNDELIKGLTGGDTINARHPFGRPFTYVPAAKFFLRVNDLPVISDQSHGMWRRVKLVPFTQTFGVDTTLADQLAREAPGILSWAVRGCLNWQRTGLQHPRAVETATKEYQAESDPLVRFLDERCVVSPAAKVSAGELFGAYEAWCRQEQTSAFSTMSQTAFGLRIRKQFQAKETGRNKTVTYFGLGLRADP